MQKLLKSFNNEVKSYDKFLLLLILSLPFLLSISIFIADLVGSIAAITLMFIYFKKKIYFFESIKKEIIIFVIFYFVILISLLNTDYFKISFLASFFYFRYFLVSLSIFYLLKKYEFLIKLFYYVILFSFLFVIFDAFIQYIFGSNLIGYDYPHKGYPNVMKIMTGFFNDEKKLGSYLVRFLPLVLSLAYLNKSKDRSILLIMCFFASSIYLSSERTALFYFILIFGFYFFISKKKGMAFFIIILLSITLLNTNSLLKNKYTRYTLDQMGIINIKDNKLNSFNQFKLYSEEHENFIHTALIIFKENIYFGSGIKTFYTKCSELKIKHKRINKCSTHPHSTYPQILSEIGIFGFLIIFLLLSYIIFSIVKLLYYIMRESNGGKYIPIYFISVGILINIFPLTPSGNFFNNWLSLVLFYSLGFFIFLNKKISS
mgnify:CR=1 FL=1